jgi:cytochrome bd-type quinol oxidase subunit 2
VKSADPAIILPFITFCWFAYLLWYFVVNKSIAWRDEFLMRNAERETPRSLWGFLGLLIVLYLSPVVLDKLFLLTVVQSNSHNSPAIFATYVLSLHIPAIFFIYLLLNKHWAVEHRKKLKENRRQKTIYMTNFLATGIFYSLIVHSLLSEVIWRTGIFQQIGQFNILFIVLFLAIIVFGLAVINNQSIKRTDEFIEFEETPLADDLYQLSAQYLKLAPKWKAVNIKRKLSKSSNSLEAEIGKDLLSWWSTMKLKSPAVHRFLLHKLPSDAVVAVVAIKYARTMDFKDKSRWHTWKNNAIHYILLILGAVLLFLSFLSGFQGLQIPLLSPVYIFPLAFLMIFMAFFIKLSGLLGGKDVYHRAFTSWQKVVGPDTGTIALFSEDLVLFDRLLMYSMELEKQLLLVKSNKRLNAFIKTFPDEEQKRVAEVFKPEYWTDKLD